MQLLATITALQSAAYGGLLVPAVAVASPVAPSVSDVPGEAWAEDEACSSGDSSCGLSLRQLRGWQRELSAQGGSPLAGRSLGALPDPASAASAAIGSKGGGNRTESVNASARSANRSAGGGDGVAAALSKSTAGSPAADSAIDNATGDANGSRDANASNASGGSADGANASGHAGGANASGANVSGTNASGANASGANASGANASGANASGANASANATDEADWPLWTQPELYHNSTAPLLTFYMYRAVSNESYPPLSVNTASLGGVLWYLHNEVVHHSPRKFGITRIVRLRVQTRATQPLFERGMNFGVRLAFDSGQATGPLACGRSGARFELCGTAYNASFRTGAHARSQAKAFEWDAYGYFVGCNNLGSFPFPLTPTQYPGAAWYSLPGPCPSRSFRERDAACDARQPGGLCEGAPGGSGNCTWSYEEAGEVSLDELVGIPDYAAFLASGRREYVKATDRGYGFTWWDSVHDRLANLWRMQKVDALFAERYPGLPRDAELPAPPCDFSYNRFYQDPGFYATPCRTAKRGDRCFREVVYAKSTGIRRHPDWYPGLTPASGFRAFQALLHRTGPTRGPCPPPCDDAAATCHTAAPGERCWKDVRYAMRDGIYGHPQWYPGLSPRSSLEDFQRYLFETGKAPACGEPCAAPPAA